MFMVIHRRNGIKILEEELRKETEDLKYGHLDTETKEHSKFRIKILKERIKALKVTTK
jgi:hypothetical protein